MGLLQEKYKNYREPQKYMEAGVYPYFREITGKQGTEVQMDGHEVDRNRSIWNRMCGKPFPERNVGFARQA